MCWDQNAQRLAITFKNSGSLVVFQTAISEAVVDCIPLYVTNFGVFKFCELIVNNVCFSCIIQGRLDEEPSTIAFKPTYKQGSLLTIVCIKL